MIVCIDTNAVLGLFTTGHVHRLIFEAWFAGQLHWAVSTEILLEYEEVMQRQGSPAKATMMLKIMDLVNARLGNMVLTSPSYRFRLITGDADDDKFADCAIAAEAYYIITEDRHLHEMPLRGGFRFMRRAA